MLLVRMLKWKMWKFAENILFIEFIEIKMVRGAVQYMMRCNYIHLQNAMHVTVGFISASNAPDKNKLGREATNAGENWLSGRKYFS